MFQTQRGAGSLFVDFGFEIGEEVLQFGGDE